MVRNQITNYFAEELTSHPQSCRNITNRMLVRFMLLTGAILIYENGV